jgi:hypothetical protein
MMRRGFIASAHSGSSDVRPRASQLRASVDQGLAMAVEFYAKTLGKTPAREDFEGSAAEQLRSAARPTV